MQTKVRSLLVAAMLSCACGDSKTSSSAGGGDDAGAAQPNDGPTQLTGTLGALGAVKATVSSIVISNSGETLIYLTSARLTCEQVMVSRWLGAFAPNAQVVEIVVSGPAKVGKAESAEVNFAAGGKSSAYEQSATSTSVTFTKSEPEGIVEGTVSASYANPKGNVAGAFHAEFCPGGQGY